MNILEKAKKFKSSHLTSQANHLSTDSQNLQKANNKNSNLTISVDEINDPKKGKETTKVVPAKPARENSQLTSDNRALQLTYRWDELKQTAKFQHKKQQLRDMSLMNSIIDLGMIDSADSPSQKKADTVPIVVGKIFEKFQSRVPSTINRSQVLARSNSKLKLRDYLYMVEASSKRSLNKSLNKSQSSLMQGKSQPPGRLGSKYHLSDGQMLQILKKDLKQDIKETYLKLEKLQNALSEVKGQSSSYDEKDKARLLTLYHVRRVIKEDISKLIQTSIAQLQAHNENDKQSTPKKPS